MFGWDDAITAGLVAGSFIYHRWLETPPPKPPWEKLSIPRVDAGSPYPIYYGQCRIKSPVLAWVNPQPLAFYQNSGNSPLFGFATDLYKQQDRYVYFANMFFVIGIPFEDGDQSIRAIYAGDTQMQSGGTSGGLAHLDGNGNFEDSRRGPCTLFMPNYTTNMMGGFVEFLNGNRTQTLIDYGTLVASTEAGEYMSAPGSSAFSVAWANQLRGGGGISAAAPAASLIPGYRGFTSVLLYNNNPSTTPGGDATIKNFVIGPDPTLPHFSFEMQSYSNAAFNINRKIGVDSNPIHIAYDIVTGTKGKLGIDGSFVDEPSFSAAADRLHSDQDLIGGLGMSRSWEGNETADEMLQEIARLIDGVFYVDPIDQKLHVRLIRNDYIPSTLARIDPSNCEKLEAFAGGGWTAVTNKVRVNFPLRTNGYRTGTATAFNLATSIAQSDNRETVITHEGITTQFAANSIAGRELAARSRPLFKCQAIVDRSFWRTNPGDVVLVNWPRLGIANGVFRVASVNRGLLADRKVVLNLIQDYFFVWRNRPPVVVGTWTRPVGITHV